MSLLVLVLAYRTELAIPIHVSIVHDDNPGASDCFHWIKKGSRSNALAKS